MSKSTFPVFTYSSYYKEEKLEMVSEITDETTGYMVDWDYAGYGTETPCHCGGHIKMEVYKDVSSLR